MTAALATNEPLVFLTVAQAKRIREALAKSEFALRRVEHTRAHPLSGAARDARSEIGAAVAHLDRALPPVEVDVVTDVRIAGPGMEDSRVDV